MDLQQPVKAAAAAGLAWLATMPLDGTAETYALYAPFGAVVAISTTVVGSLREAAQIVLAIACGVLLAIAAAPLPNLVGLLVVVGGGFLVIELPWVRRLGDVAGWVPISAMFALVLGGSSVWDYAAAYLGLTTFGAAFGLLVNALWPPMALDATDRALTRLKDVLAAQFDGIAEGLRGERPPTLEEWSATLQEVEPAVAGVRRIPAQTRDSGRVNWRASRWREKTQRTHERVRSLEHLAFLVEDLTLLVREHERADLQEVALGPALRPPAADALEALAEVLRLGPDDERQDTVAAARDATDAFVVAMRAQRESTGGDILTAGGIITAILRALAALEPREE